MLLELLCDECSGHGEFYRRAISRVEDLEGPILCQNCSGNGQVPITQKEFRRFVYEQEKLLVVTRRYNMNICRLTTQVLELVHQLRGV